MKKFFVFAAVAAFALVACTKEQTVKPGEGVVLNELSGAEKYIELYNTTDKVVSLEGVVLPV